VTNLDEKVTVTVWNTPHEEVWIGYPVIIALLVGALLAGIVAVVEGMQIRLDNRRLTREIHRMTTEINFLRTQPTGAERPEPDALERSSAEPLPSPPVQPAPAPPSAPIYDTEQNDWPPDDDDEEDAYTGGRAV
jgi:hypothetical protein